MVFRDLRKLSGMTQKAYSAYFGIPVRTVEDWDTGKRVPPPYLLELMAYKLEKEGMMQKDKGV